MPGSQIAALLLAAVVVLLLVTAAGIGLGWFRGETPLVPFPRPRPKYPCPPPSPNVGAIRAYLAKVYPSGPWAKVSDCTVEQFFDTLGFYYNCCHSYSKGDLTNGAADGDARGGGWAALPCCQMMPAGLRTPRGNFLTFESYHRANQPVAVLDGRGLLKDWGSYRETMTLGAFGSAGVMQEYGRTARSGPGPIWCTPYSLQRYLYAPNGIWYKDGTWSVVCNMSPSLPNMGCSPLPHSQWAYDWTKGVAPGGFLEVSHIQTVPSVAPSTPGYWLNVYPGGGTGVFYQVGDPTRIGTNKIDLCVKMYAELAGKTAAQLRGSLGGTKYRGMSGAQVLTEIYGTSDTTSICWGYFLANMPAKAYCKDRQYPLIDTTDAAAWSSLTLGGLLGASGLVASPTDIATSRRDGSGYRGVAVSTRQVARWWLGRNPGPGGDKTFSPANQKRVLARVATPLAPDDYFLNACAIPMTFDEPLGWLGLVLGVQTLQSVAAPNGNGLWYYECCDLRLPDWFGTYKGGGDKTWLDLAKERVYQWIIPAESGVGGMDFDLGTVQMWNSYMQNFLTMRNPLDVADASAARHCTSLAVVPTIKTETQCETNPLYPDISDKDFGALRQPPNTGPGGGYWGAGLDGEGDACWFGAAPGMTGPPIAWGGFPCVPGTLNFQYSVVDLETAGFPVQKK
jgi:hypothetical protein